jgi:hypothetical protein
VAIMAAAAAAHFCARNAARLPLINAMDPARLITTTDACM